MEVVIKYNEGVLIYGDKRFDLDGGHTVQYVDLVTQKSITETYMILTNVGPNKFNLKRGGNKQKEQDSTEVQ